MPHPTAVKFYGSIAGGVIGLLSSIGVIAAENALTVNTDYLRKQQETAIVRKYEGTETLEQLITSRGFEIKFTEGYREPSLLVASVNMHDALADACETKEFGQTPVCSEYSQIAPNVSVQSEINSGYNWLRGLGLGFMAAALASLSYAGSLLLLERRRIRREKDLHDQPARG